MLKVNKSIVWNQSDQKSQFNLHHTWSSCKKNFNLPEMSAAQEKRMGMKMMSVLKKTVGRKQTGDEDGE